MERMRLTTKSVVTAVGIVTMMIMGAAVLFFARHHDSRSVSAGEASAEFAELQSRFVNQQPLLDMQQRRARDGTSSRTARPLHAFHTVIFDTRGGERLVRITAPYWLARAFARHDGQFRWLGELTFLDDTEFDPEAIELTLSQIERHGPGLLVDYRHANGGRFMAWVD
jgi:hypothetical protein